MTEQHIMSTRGPVIVFVDDATATAPTWALCRTRWHFIFKTGIAACGFVGSFSSWDVQQHFRPHTPRKMYERTITSLCPKCERLVRRPALNGKEQG